MTSAVDCPENLDPTALVRDGTDQARRSAAAPDPARVRVDDRRTEHGMVFASAYARYLQYVGPDGAPDGDWRDFFSSDALAQVAVLAIEDVSVYRTTMSRLLTELQDPEPTTTAAEAMGDLRAVFDCVGTLSQRLDELTMSLPPDHLLRARAHDLITTRLSPALRLLIACFRAGVTLGVVDATAPARTGITILGRRLRRFDQVIATPGLSPAWPAGLVLADWSTYAAVDPAQGARLYGSGVDQLELVNHLARHNLFTAACEAFLGALARLVEEARGAIRSGTTGDDHQPHYALLLAFLEMLAQARAETEALPAKHLDFYYRRVLGLRERPAQPSHAHVLAELAKHVDAHLVPAGTLIRAGKDATGADQHFAVERDLVANRARVAEVRRLYRHPHDGPLPAAADRLFAGPVAPADGPWHPFAEKVYADSALRSIAMPRAEVGFAIASHHLWLAGGERTITVRIRAEQVRAGAGVIPVRLLCRLTTEKGWLERTVDEMSFEGRDLTFDLTLTGGDPPIVPYVAATHGYRFGTGLPVLVVTAVNEPGTGWSYPDLAAVTLRGLTLSVHVEGLRAVTLANDHGPVDPSKPFLPFGSTPSAGSALVIGSKEALQKQPSELRLGIEVMVGGTPSDTTPTASAQELRDGAWRDVEFYDDWSDAAVIAGLAQPLPEEPDLTPDVAYSTEARSGFARVVLSEGYGTDAYPLALAKFIAGHGTEPTRPVLPMWASLSLAYESEQQVGDGASPSNGLFFHVTPFGHVAQSPSGGASLLPRFVTRGQPSEGELYLGVASLQPPQDLTLLFQVVDGTADPRVAKPEQHLAWTYLRGDEWVEFAPDAVAEGTGGMLASGIVTLAVPADATTEHTLLPRGTHWLRASVATHADAVCRLREVAAQALSATSVVAGAGASPDPSELPAGTLSKLVTPDAAVKGIAQRYATFGGRPAESPVAFAARVSERLRHKDRASTMWDYEHLVLEAFPSIHSVRCLNHTWYEPTSDGAGVYRELAPGHVTVVTIPNLEVPDARDPLRPFTSLRLLGEIERFLAGRTSCFVQLRVRNPQFEEVRTDLRVRFRQGVDETFHVNRLKREITEFLSPWAFRSAARPTFNGRIRKSVLVDFIEERDYVDYLTDVRLFHRLPGSTVDGPDRDEVSGSRAVSILVSVPPAQHGVAVIHDDEVAVVADCGCAGVVAR
jgi:Baseplate J-like protein